MRIYALTYLRSTCHEVATRYGDEGFTVFEVTGEQSPQDRYERCAAFTACQDARVVLVATIDAMQLAVDIGPVDAVSIVEEHPRRAATLQAKSRATSNNKMQLN